MNKFGKFCGVFCVLSVYAHIFEYCLFTGSYGMYLKANDFHKDCRANVKKNSSDSQTSPIFTFFEIFNTIRTLALFYLFLLSHKYFQCIVFEKMAPALNDVQVGRV